ncbi:anthranilate synthase component II [Halobacteriales archaeon Cl-PHB]
MRVLVVDNYDSFAYNLVQYVGEVVTDEAYTAVPDGEVLVRRNDEISLGGIVDLAPDAIVVSPGPGTPEGAGVSVPIFADLSIPTLGVCLGHQALCAARGATVGHAPAVVHGKPSEISHDGTGVFRDLPDPIAVGRYHSLAVEVGGLPDGLVETARTTDASDVAMAVRAADRPHVGVQFHPESILTDDGTELLANFLADATADAWPRRR